MKKSRYSDSQIMTIIKQADAGTPVPELCREDGMSSVSFCKWRGKYGGMNTSMMTRLKELEDENRHTAANLLSPREFERRFESETRKYLLNTWRST